MLKLGTLKLGTLKLGTLKLGMLGIPLHAERTAPHRISTITRLCIRFRAIAITVTPRIFFISTPLRRVT
jgi:hypothetical protein